MADSSAVGINLAANTYYSSEFPFIDRMKTAGSWIANGATAPVPLDKNGYPTGIPAGASSLYTLVGLDPLSAGTSNTYVLTYTGNASLYLGNAKILSSEPGKITFQYTDASTNQMLVAIGGLDPKAPLGNMHIVRSDQVDLFNSGEIFNPAFTSKISQFDTLRYMDWGNTNASTVQNWSDRTPLNNVTWSTAAGVPIEAMVALANETKTNMWLNIPTYATDDYVRQEMTYVHDHLDPSLSVHLEYSNEVWNWQFQQAGYAAGQGAKLWDKDANGDGVIDQTDPAEHYGPDWVTYYGYRAAQIASIANQAFGSDDARLHNVLATQTQYEGLEGFIVDGVKRAGVGSVSDLFDDYAVTTYFGGNLRGLNDADKATIVSWAKEGDAGVTAAIAAIKDGTGLSSSDDSLAYVKQLLTYQGAVASKLGLNLVAYEGGQDTDAGAFGANYAVVADFLKRVQADPRMGELYTQMLADFSSVGGKLDNPLIDIDAGLYGTLKSVYDQGSPEWNALVAAEKTVSGAGTAGAVTVPSVVDTPVATTPVSSIPVTTAPVTTTPVSSTPVTTAPITTTPVSSTPVTTAPITTTPVSSTPVTTAPITTTPVSSTPVTTAPVTTPVITSPALPAGLTDKASYTMADGEKIIAYVGSDMFTAVGNDLDDTITAGDGGSHLNGGAGNDVLVGGAGNDWLDGGTGADTMIGGAGDDTYVVDNPGDVVIEKANGGTDEVRTTLASYTLDPNVEKLTYTGSGFFTGAGNDLANIITAGDGGSKLSGGGGDDRLVGGAGNDYLDGGTGADTMVGGAGDDTYVVDNPGDVVIEKANGGTDEVRTTLASYALPDQVENLTYYGIGAFTGVGNDLANIITAGDGGSKLSGGGGDDRLVGGAGNDYLDGGTGADTMVGGAGDDTYVVDNPGDVVIEKANGGTDEVRTTLASYTLGDNVENLTSTGGGFFTGTGNNLANTIIAGDGGSKLSGGTGDDTLIGGAGNDYLDGGAGADRMVGGAGDDVYIVDNPGDVVVEAPGGGTDEVRTTLASYALPDQVEKLTYAGSGDFTGTGNDQANTIIGGAGNNRLYGGGGADTLVGGAGNDWLDGGTGDDVMTGGAGNDVYVVDSAGDQVIEAPNAGTDEVRTTLASYTLGDNVENLTSTGSGFFTGTGNALGNVLTAGDGGSKLSGGGGDDTLIGGAGNDYLDGGAGADRMVGGAGDDVYVVDDYRDTVVELSGGGTDEIRTSLPAYVLQANVENLTYTGAGAFQAMGNALDNVITGGAGVNRLLGGDGNDTLIGGNSADVLDGGTGADRMVGGGGNDIYFVDNPGDQVVEAPGGGTDTVYSSITYTLAPNVENLQLIGGGVTDGTGNELNNTIMGNDAANHLWGGAGNDLLYGGAGDDTLDGGTGDDTLVGDDGNDTLYGGAGNDVLVGGAGNDVLVGGPGADSLTGGTGADRFFFQVGDLNADPAKTDTITDFSHADGDKIDLSGYDANTTTAARDAFTFIGKAAFTKHAGELRIDTSGGAYLVISGDLNGDGVADFALNVSKSAGTLIASDFVL